MDNGSRVDANAFVEGTEVTDYAQEPKEYVYNTIIPRQYFYDFRGKRGLLIILNHFQYIARNFRIPPTPRHGTAEDVKRLRKTFEMLNFRVQTPYTDLTYNKIMDVMQSVAKADHSSTSCVVVCVMTHGEAGGKLLAADREYPARDLFSCLEGDSCPQLALIPKLFFIQACRGKDYDDGVEVDSQTSDSIKIPSTANFLIMYSTVEDFVSWRDGCGSWFMQALCNELEGRYEHMDLLHILTFVNWHIAYCRASNTGIVQTHDKRQMPQIVSTLTKLITFSQKF